MTAPPSLWHAGPAPAPRPPLRGDATADVAIVGGGIAGLSTALALARRGLSVRVLEARTLGWGASGRNAGFVVPNFSRADPGAVRRALGPARADRLLAMVGGGADAVFGFARDAGLGDLAAQTGWLHAAHTDAMADRLRARVADWQALGRPVTWLEPAEATRRTGLARTRGALRDASGGTIDPLAFVRALATAAERAGATLHEATPVSDIARGFRLATPGGTLTAGRVLLASNADPTGAARRLARTVVPLSVYQIATAPIPRAWIDRFSPFREPVADTRDTIFTYRLTRDDRLISGGMALVPIGAERRMGQRIARRLARELSLPRVPDVAHVWRGTAAMTTNALPHVTEHEPGLFGVIGCNGRGIATCMALGPDLADALDGTRAPADIALPLAAPRAIPFRPVAHAAPSLILLRGMIAERTAR